MIIMTKGIHYMPLYDTTMHSTHSRANTHQWRRALSQRPDLSSILPACPLTHTSSHQSPCTYIVAPRGTRKAFFPFRAPLGASLKSHTSQNLGSQISDELCHLPVQVLWRGCAGEARHHLALTVHKELWAWHGWHAEWHAERSTQHGTVPGTVRRCGTAIMQDRAHTMCFGVYVIHHSAARWRGRRLQARHGTSGSRAGTQGGLVRASRCRAKCVG